jgi:hypothetical protein
MTTMSEPIVPAVTPIGHQGAGVKISERWSVTGWLGVVLVLGCGYLVWWLLSTKATGWIWLPLLVGVVVVLSLVVVPPGQTRVVLFFGRYVGSLRSPGFALLAP